MMLVWLSVWSEMQIVCIWYIIRCDCHPKPHHLLPHLNPDWYRLIWVVLEKRPLDGCSSSSNSCSSSSYICRPDDARHLLVCRTSTLSLCLSTLTTLSTHFSATNIPTPSVCALLPIQNSLYLLHIAPKNLHPLGIASINVRTASSSGG